MGKNIDTVLKGGYIFLSVIVAVLPAANSCGKDELRCSLTHCNRIWSIKKSRFTKLKCLFPISVE